MNTEIYFNHYGYSDINPFEVVRKVSDKTYEIRAMSYERDPSWNPNFTPGGFFGHVDNQSGQRWIITSNPDSEIVRIRLGKHGWKCKHGRRFGMSEKPVKFYDYNF